MNDLRPATCDLHPADDRRPPTSTSRIALEDHREVDLVVRPLRDRAPNPRVMTVQDVLQMRRAVVPHLDRYICGVRPVHVEIPRQVLPGVAVPPFDLVDQARIVAAVR